MSNQNYGPNGPGQPPAGPTGAQPQPGSSYPGQSPQQPYGGGNPPGGPLPPAPSKGGGMGKWIAIGAAVLIVAVIAVWALTQRGSDSPAETETATVPSAPATGGTNMKDLEVGQCLQFVEVPGATPDASGSIDVTHKVVDCNLAGQFKHQVVSVTRGAAECSAADYTKYYQTGIAQQLTICVAPIFEVGACYDTDPITDWRNVPCTADAYFKIISELPGVDKAACAYPDESFSLPDPAPGKVYCIGDPAA